jgi:heavy metal translocating P-type ATPase
METEKIETSPEFESERGGPSLNRYQNLVENRDAGKRERNASPGYLNFSHSSMSQRISDFLRLSPSAQRGLRPGKVFGDGFQKLESRGNSLESEVKSEAFTIQVDEEYQKEPSPEISNEYVVRLGVGGMTCASCSGTIRNAVGQLKFVKSVDINLLQNCATVGFGGPRGNVKKIVEAIEVLGYEAAVEMLSHTLLPSANSQKNPSSSFLAHFSIEGMTCSACSASVTRGVKELPFVNIVSIDFVTNSGAVEFEGEDHLDEIKEKIEDLGYDVIVITCESLDQKSDLSDRQLTERTTMVKINGMFSHHCPSQVLNALEKLSGHSITIKKAPTFKSPIVTLTYVPQPPLFTIRNIIAAINSANQAFTARIYHPPTIEERSRAIQQHERRRLTYRLFFTLIVAIPTFLFGVVFMSLVPSNNRVRSYLEESMWAGAVTRTEWALFFLATPVMFFGADVFHVRAVKEIRALWRRGRSVPILRRFLRFGSMSLLISAGTSVAYFSSLVLLVVNATVTANGNRHMTTYFDTVVFLTFFILIGKLLEAYSKAKTGDAVSLLGELRPSEALLINLSRTNEASNGGSEMDDAGVIQRISADLVEVGDHVNVPHGASPPADGIVDPSDNVYQFDESTLTGESIPVNKSQGDKVFAGSVNVGQPVQIRVTNTGGTSMLDQIVSVVREGQTKRAPVERLADIITGYFVPVITFVAIFTFLIWTGLGQGGVLPKDYLDVDQGGWEFWSLEFAIAVFVVACPCGLGLAAPTALFVGIGLAAKNGILVRGGGEAFQEASHLDAIVFDKTGTLTEGRNLKVTDHQVLPSDEAEESIGWAITKAMEETCNHPIAKAIAEFCFAKPRATIVSSSIEEISGQGIRGTFTVTTSQDSSDSSRHLKYEAIIGNERLHKSLPSFNSIGVDNKYYLQNILSTYQSACKSTAILSLRRLDSSEPSPSQSAHFIPTFVFSISDSLRPTTPSLIRTLQSTYPHISLHICTGDNPATAASVASALNIPPSNILASALPAQKAEYIRSLQNPSTTSSSTQTRRTVAFVGDGTNDTPALTAADVSVALSSGTDIAVSSASFILLSSDLTSLLPLLALSKKVFRRVKLNFMWAGIYNICLVPVAAGVFYPIGGHWKLGPVWASAAMALSSVSVVTSSLALRWF